MNGTFNFMCYASALSETTVTVQTFFNRPKVPATSKQRLPESSSPFCLLNPKVTRAVTFGILWYLSCNDIFERVALETK